MTDAGPRRLPRIFQASNGRDDWTPPRGDDIGLLLRDTDLLSLLRHVDQGYPVAVDIDSVAGMADDEAASEYLVNRLGLPFVLTRSAATGAHVASLGGVAFLRVFAVDSTGLASALKRHPRVNGVGSAISPGVVLSRLRSEELLPIPRPLLAYGLLDRPEDIAACLERADAIVLSARALAAAGVGRSRSESVDPPIRRDLR